MYRIVLIGIPHTFYMDIYIYIDKEIYISVEIIKHMNIPQ